MAWTANTQWELRTTGTSTGGGGFDATLAGAGTDYSQQDAPQLTHTDGVVSGTNLQSTAGGFTSAMKGNGVYLSGANKQYQITAFVDANNVTLDSAPGNSSGNTYHVGGAWLPTASGFVIPYVAGNKLWIGPGTYALISNALSLNQAGTADLPITVEGYTTVRGDKGSAPVIQFVTSDAVALTFNNVFQIVKHVTIDGGTHNSDVVNFTTLAHNCELIGCKIINGHGNQVNYAGSNNRVARCLIDGTNNTGAAGFGLVLMGSGIGGSILEQSVICNAPAVFTGAIADSGDSSLIQHNVIRNNGANGLWINEVNYGKLIQFNDIWANATDGILIRDLNVRFEGLQIQYNIFGKNTSYDIAFDGADQSTNVGNQEWAKANVRYNAFFTTGTGKLHNTAAGTGDVTLAGTPFKDDASTFNFTLNSGVGAACVGAGVETWPDGVNVTTYTLGALGAPLVVPVYQAAASTAGIAPTVDEVQFPTGIGEGATGGPVFQTIVMAAGNGLEQRIPMMTHGRYTWNAATGLKSPADMATITAFWLARQGRARGFRWKDWDDYQATAAPLTITGKPTAQLSKRYASGIVNYDRVVYKPVANTLTMTRNASAYAAWTVDTTTGIVSWTAIISKAITAITKASSAVVTVGASHGFVVGDILYFTGIVGMTQLNGLTATVTATASTTVTINVDSTGFTTYGSAGTASKYPQPTDVVLATFQFDVPVRFDTDVMTMTNTSSQIRQWDNLPIVELSGG